MYERKMLDCQYILTDLINYWIYLQLTLKSIIDMNMDGKISKKVYQKIHTEDIKMRPSYHFTAIFLVWRLLAAISLLLAALVFNFVWYDMRASIDQFFPLYVLVGLLFTYQGTRFYRNSCLSCKIESHKLFFWALGLVVVLAASIHSFHFGKQFHDSIEKKIEQRKVIILP